LQAQTQEMSYWQQEVGAAAPLASSEPPRQADVVIIGGGLAGVSAAAAILERQPGASVVLLEAHYIGYGASGRNGGLLSPLPAPIWLLTADRNEDHAWATRTLNKKLHTLATRLAETVPGGEIRPCGLRLQAMGLLSTSGVGKVAAVLDHVQIGHRLAPDRQRGGKPMLEIQAYTVHPYRLVRALAARAIERGARICEHAAVQAIEESQSGARIRLAGGRQLNAGRVLVCTNGYTGSIDAPSPPRAKVVRNYMVATEPLDAEAVARLGDGQTFMVELNKSYIFYRLHRGRLIYGGIETFFRSPKSDFEVPAAVRTALEKHLAASIPWRASISIATAWGGAFHSSATDLPIIRRAPGASAIVYNIGYGGTGVALTQLFAGHAAALALDLPLLDGDDARLGEIMGNTRLPIGGLLRLGSSVAWDVVTGRASAAARNSGA